MTGQGRPPLVAAVADAGVSAGLGHLRRCLNVAAALRDLGVAACFLLPDGEGGAGGAADAAAAVVRAEGFPVEPLPAVPPGAVRGGALAAAACTAAARLGATALLADAYAFDPPALAALGRGGLPVAAFDDLCASRAPLPCSLVVNGGLGAEQLPYAAGPELLLGARYAPLRPALAVPVPRPAAAPDAPLQLVAVFGGSDPTGTLPLALRALDSVEAPLAVAAVVGPLAANGDAVAHAAAASRHPVAVLHDPPELLALLRSADIAVTAGGGTLVELVAAGTPAVAVEVAANQRRGIDALVAAGAAVDAGPAGSRGLEGRIAAHVTALAACPERRAAMAAAGPALLDGRGAARIAARLAALAGAQVT